MRSVILRPILSEKSLRLSQIGQYTFLVDQRATKPEIMTTLKHLFNIDPVDVRMIRSKGVARMFRRRPGRTASSKKAIIRVKSGQKIPGFEIQAPETPAPTKKPKKQTKVV